MQPVDVAGGRGRSGSKGRGRVDVNDEGYIIEFHQVGAYVRVTIMDPATLTEVTTLGPASLSQTQLAQAAIRKLKYVMSRPEGQAAGETYRERK